MTADGSFPIYVLRHAEVESAYQGKCRGRFDCALSERGTAMSALNARFLAAHTVHRVVTSGLSRTDAVGIHAASLGVEHVVDHRFSDRCFGEWEGRSWSNIRERWPAQYDQWERHELETPPGGERMTDFCRRIAEAWSDRLTNERHSWALVAHATVNVVVLSSALRIPLTHMPQDYGCINELRCAARTSIVVRQNVFVANESDEKGPCLRLR